MGTTDRKRVLGGVDHRLYQDVAPFLGLAFRKRRPPKDLTRRLHDALAFAVREPEAAFHFRQDNHVRSDSDPPYRLRVLEQPALSEEAVSVLS